MKAIDCLIFFFFQAEDGIRDYKVTGVQTCALPILVAVAQEKDCQDRNQKQQTKQLRGIGKITIYGGYQALNALSVPPPESPESKIFFLAPAVFSSEFGRYVSPREAVFQNRRFIHTLRGIPSPT